MNDILQILQPPQSYFFYLAIAWAVLWKGIALWHAARCRQVAWYIVLLLVNTVGILEIVYVIFFRKEESNPD